jgi:glycerate 2-kinase
MITLRRDRLREHPHGDAQLKILKAALDAIEPAALIVDRLTVVEDMLRVDQLSFPLAGRKVWILSIGKASVPMASAIESLLGPERIAGGVAVTRTGYGGPTECIRVIEAGHPLPEGSDGADAVIEIARQIGPNDLVLCLLSGGGSALLASPPSGISLSELACTTALLLHSGVTIDEMNTVRRHVSQLQGGQLMARLHPATVITLILSDVIGDRLESIASGPTVPDPTSFADAVAVLERESLLDRMPQSIRSHLISGMASEVPETPPPGDPIFETAHALLLGNNSTAVRAMATAAQDLGFEVGFHPTPLIGEARDVGSQLAEQAIGLADRAKTKWALIAGGETTVTVCGDGLGGRNQELALAAALCLEGMAGLSVAALATDGTDGPTDAAGALIDGCTAQLARQRGLDPVAALERNDSHAILNVTEDLLWTGPTKTNVADVVLILGEPTA